VKPTIKIKLQDFREQFVFGTPYINDNWVSGSDWLVHNSKVLAVPDTFYHWLSDEVVEQILNEVTEFYMTAQLTTRIVYVPDRVELHRKHKLAVFQDEEGRDVCVRNRYVDTFKLRELRWTPKLMWTPDEMFFTAEVSHKKD
jgi:hypothetical protein